MPESNSLYTMALSLNKKKLNLSLLGAALVITGVCLKNGFEQLKAPEPNLGAKLGPLAFGAGWLITGLAIAAPAAGKGWIRLPTSTTGWLAMAASAGVFMSVMKMKKEMKKGNEAPKMLGAIFAGSWALLAYALMRQAKFSQLSMALGVGAVGLVLGSMWKVLKWQRKNCVVDWFGMPMFTAAWGCVAVANAI